jgi:hypothetical protein
MEMKKVAMALTGGASGRAKTSRAAASVIANSMPSGEAIRPGGAIRTATR